jgi:hypothetical protein
MDSKIRKYIQVNLQVEGLHKWGDCNLEDVIYLRNLHRHIFHIKVIKQVTHNNRDIEIIMFKNQILFYLKGKYKGNFGNMSCEDIAEDILKEFDCHIVEVLEDNENGAIVSR